MRLEEQVVSLELAKELKELGVKQESLFTWFRRYNPEHDEHDYIIELTSEFNQSGEDYSAFTVAEVGELIGCRGTTLPIYHDSYVSHLINQRQDGTWGIGDYIGESGTEADARAKLLIHLIEEGIIKTNEQGDSN